MKESLPKTVLPLTPSTYFAESFVRTDLRKAWNILQDYQAWNPSFVGATVTLVRGERNCVGSVVQIRISQAVTGPTSFPEYYAETVAVVPDRRVIWFCSAKEGQTYQGQEDPFRNFVDFGLTEEAGGIKFNIQYYAQNRLEGDDLNKEREGRRLGTRSTAEAFRDYCHRQISGSSPARDGTREFGG